MEAHQIVTLSGTLFAVMGFTGAAPWADRRFAVFLGIVTMITGLFLRFTP